MPLEGVFIETPSSSTKQIPDLSLNISPPTSLDLSGRRCVTEVSENHEKLLPEFSKTGNCLTELSLAHPTNITTTTTTTIANTNTVINDDTTTRRGFLDHLPRNPYYNNHHYQHQHQHQHQSQNYSHLVQPMNQINHGVSSLDVSDGLRPIKGIPVYNHNRSFPFLATNIDKEKDPKMCFYPSSSPPPSSSPSPSYSYQDHGHHHQDGRRRKGPRSRSRRE